MEAAERLTALDATFLGLEEADHSAHMHIGGVIVLAARPGGGAPPLDRVRTEVLARLGGLPRYRQRLSEPRTGGLRWPTWDPDPDFDIGNHVRAEGLAAPAGIAKLRAWAGEYFSIRLDRRRPLRELVVIELADGRWAPVTKTTTAWSTGSDRSMRPRSCSTPLRTRRRAPSRPSRTGPLRSRGKRPAPGGRDCASTRGRSPPVDCGPPELRCGSRRGRWSRSPRRSSAPPTHTGWRRRCESRGRSLSCWPATSWSRRRRAASTPRSAPTADWRCSRFRSTP